MATRALSPLIRRGLLAANLAAPFAVVATGLESWSVIVAAAVLHAALIYALTAPGCEWLGPVVTRFRTTAKEVWLTIDDGPIGAESERLADELARRGVRATFFVKGSNLDAHQEHAAKCEAVGHTLANHTQTHPSLHFWWLLPSKLRRELDGCDAALARAGVTVRRWFRSPVGLKHPLLHRELAARGLRLIAWNVRGRDGVTDDPEAVTRRVLRQVRPGAIVVLHEGRPRSVEGVLRVITALQQLGYSFVIPTDEQLI